MKYTAYDDPNGEYFYQTDDGCKFASGAAAVRYCEANDGDGMSDNETQEAIDLLRDAQDHMREALAALKQVARMTHDRYYTAYIIDHLEIMTSSDHGFMSRDANLDDWISALENGEN